MIYLLFYFFSFTSFRPPIYHFVQSPVIVLRWTKKRAKRLGNELNCAEWSNGIVNIKYKPDAHNQGPYSYSICSIVGTNFWALTSFQFLFFLFFFIFIFFYFIPFYSICIKPYLYGWKRKQLFWFCVRTSFESFLVYIVDVSVSTHINFCTLFNWKRLS